MPISPPTVDFSFGSFGDIITVLQLAWALRAALDESAGASAELRALVRDVDAFTRALQDVQANIERRRKTLRPDVVNGIAAALSRCRNVLSAIQQRIERARGQTSTSGWHKYWGTAAWSILGGKKDVEALRARLSEQLGIMQLYLSLSEATTQEHVQEMLLEHGATLKRVYAVVQEIQLRFDVGVPSFRFYDYSTKEYYLPLARTSLQRLREVHDALRRVAAHPDMISSLSQDSGITMDDFAHRTELSSSVWIPLNCDGDEVNGGYLAECFFFREAAFGEWQVLVRAQTLPPRQREALKTLLERKHTASVNCNCAVSCSTRYRGYAEDLVQSHEVCSLYSEAVALIFQRLQPGRCNSGWLNKIADRYRKWPDLEQLRSTVLPALRQQQLSFDEMVALLANAPLSSGPADDVPCQYGADSVYFPVHGTALASLLLGNPVDFPGDPNYPARMPDWAQFETSNNGEGFPRFAFRKKIVESSSMCDSRVDARAADT